MTRQDLPRLETVARRQDQLVGGSVCADSGRPDQQAKVRRQRPARRAMRRPSAARRERAGTASEDLQLTARRSQQGRCEGLRHNEGRAEAAGKRAGACIQRRSGTKHRRPAMSGSVRGRSRRNRHGVQHGSVFSAEKYPQEVASRSRSKPCRPVPPCSTGKLTIPASKLIRDPRQSVGQRTKSNLFRGTT